MSDLLENQLSTELRSSSTRERIARLREVLEAVQLKGYELSSGPLLVANLFNTYALYYDRPSRQAVKDCLQAVFDSSTNGFRELISLLQIESTQQSLAASNLFVLLDWSCLTLQYCANQEELWRQFGRNIARTTAQLLQSLQASPSRASLQESALVLTRRALRRLFRAKYAGPSVVSMLVQDLSSKGGPGQCAIPFLGVIAGVCQRLRSSPQPSSETLYDNLLKNKTFYFEVWNREVTAAKLTVAAPVAKGFADFWSHFVTYEDVEKDITPAFEKALLRSPEVILQGVAQEMFFSLPNSLDLSEITRQKLLKPLLSNFKSSNASIRSGALKTIQILTDHCHNTEPVSKEISQPLLASKLTSADQRCLHAEALASIAPSITISEPLCEGLAALVSKEQNETALAAESAALIVHAEFLVAKDSAVVSAVLDAIIKGLRQRRISVQRIWALRSGEFVWQCLNSVSDERLLVTAVATVLPELQKLFVEVESNPLQAAQSGSIICAYILLALCQKISNFSSIELPEKLRNSEVLRRALDSDVKSSFLLNPKVFTKLQSPEDLTWFVRALDACGTSIHTLPHGSLAAQAWFHGFLWLISSRLDHSVQREALQILTTLYRDDPDGMSENTIRGIWTWFWMLEEQKKDAVASLTPSGMAQVYLALECVCPTTYIKPRSVSSGSPQMQSLARQMIGMLVLCQGNIIPKANWIKVCINAGIDPGELVREHKTECIDRVNEIINQNDLRTAPSDTVYKAAYRTFAELAFVDPQGITPLLAAQIRQDLDIHSLKQYTPTDFAIAKTPSGTTFVDVLSNSSNELDKSAADYDTQRWERELREQIAAKKGHQKKLTADEEARVKVQLDKEAAIRQGVLNLARKLRRGIATIDALVFGPPNDVIRWFGSSLAVLANAIEANVGLLLGDEAEKVYVSCSRFVASRLGPMKTFVGIATIRALGSAHLDLECREEPLEHLVTRILYRLHLAAEQRPFDAISLTYMMPLISTVLERHASWTNDQDSADEQLTLALEFLSFHGDAFSETTLPRARILQNIVQSMQNFTQHYRLLKDVLHHISKSIGGNASVEEVDQLLQGSLVPQESVRNAVLQAIRDHFDLTFLDFSREVWLAYHDDISDNAAIAYAIWEENALEADGSEYGQLLPFLANKDKALRRATARALAHLSILDSHQFEPLMKDLEELYQDQNRPVAPQKDKFGLVKRTDLKDPWEARDGVALTFGELRMSFPGGKLSTFMRFLTSSGALGDRNTEVRGDMITSATGIISSNGASELEDLMRMFESVLSSSDQASAQSDLINEAVVVLYGSLAMHLKEGDTRVPDVVQLLLKTLSTPSETVQYAVASRLPPLIRTSLDFTSSYIQRVMEQLFASESYAARRGAAYGLAGIVSGKGISALKDFRIMPILKSAIEDKKDSVKRQAAMMAYELLSLVLGRTFEPYVIRVVPQLISGFGDTSADVRDACLDASKTLFSTLSSYGVKVILPTLLEGLEEDQWRSKRGACELLGAMAYLDPQQLAFSLPDIIPPLTNVLNDTHKEVRAAANRSLQRFGEVISNPEIKGLVNILLKALSDPTKYTDEALDSLIKINFVHYLDAPSLALVVRILGRGLGDRSATKRKSSQIIGSLAHLTEKRDLVVHLPLLVAGLRVAAVDPVPTTRATASKALGSLVEKLGEDTLPDLIPNLMSTLKADTGAGDRLGSAQALSEVLAGLGTGRLEETLPTILQNVSSNRPSVREGFMSLFIFLPACFGNNFASYLNRIIPSILGGLADEVESIRDTALRAGRLIVKNFATKAIDLLLPELDRGLSDDNYRIRLSSVELVGDLLFNLTGITAKQDTEDDDSGAVEAGQSLLEVLGEERRNKILSSLFICRNDVSGLVRSAAVNVWKALVASPRTLKELIPTLAQLLIKRLASSNMEHKVIAGNALGELIRKSGEGVLSILLPSLENGLQTSSDVDERQGICIALREVISSSSPESLEDYEKTLISVVRTALVDSNAEVRETAAEAFDSLQALFGKRAVDEVLPHLLSLLRKADEADSALGALLTLLTDNTRSNIILPNLLPTLMVAPISAFNARAIASLSQVAGDAFVRRIPTILNTLMDGVLSCKDAELQKELEAAFDTVLINIDEYDGLNASMSVLLAMAKHDDHRKRAAAGRRLGNFFEKSSVDYSRYNQDLIRVLLLSFNDGDKDVVTAAWGALSSLIEHLKKEEMESLVPSTRQVIQQVGVAGSDLPGFGLPKGIAAILRLLTQGLMNGSTEQRIQAALALSDVVDRTSVEGLKPYVTNITGPLIRVVSEKSTDLRSAILYTLNNLLEKVPLLLKPFLPQLQRTFAKSLSDSSSDLLRNRAAKALGTLLNLKPRVDPLIAELVTGAKTTDEGVRTAMLKALFEVVSKAGESMSDTSRNSILGLIDSDVGHASDSAITTNARLLGTLVRVLPPDISHPLIRQRALTTRFTLSSILNLNAILLEASSELLRQFAHETASIISQGLTHQVASIVENSVLAAAKYLLKGEPIISFENSRIVVEALATIVVQGNHASTRRLGLVTIRTVARQNPNMLRPYSSQLAPAIFGGVRDITIPVKLAAEAAFVALFSVVEQGSASFERYISTAELSVQQKRSMHDYFKRVTTRLAAQARERMEAEGGRGGLGLSNDELEDERELMSVGRVELSDVFSEIG